MVFPLPAHTARKRFGQNFLVDQRIINHIVRSVGPKAQDTLVEIGPGQGAITALLLNACPGLQVVELDRDLIPILRAQFPLLRIHQADALKFNFGALATAETPLRIVGNLPYNISTPLIFHLLSFRQCVQDMHFMLQKEVVQRMAAAPGNGHYGRLSLMTQYYCQVEHLFDVPPESFRPMPKVDSAIVRLVPHRQLPCVATDETLLETLIRTAFSQRRKTLRNALSPLVDAAILAELNIDSKLRPENLPLSAFVAISNVLAQQAVGQG